MTDLEMTKACAEAMGYQTAMRETPFTERGVKVLFAAPYDDPQWQVYNPLLNDAQAMALVKKFHLHIMIWDTLPTARGDLPAGWWRVDSQNGEVESRDADLNRAIVKCVAKLKERP